MNEVKEPKKPMMFYYLAVLIVIVLLNLFISPMLVSGNAKKVAYSTFISDTENNKIKKAIISSKDIFYTDSEGNNYYTSVINDPDLVKRLSEHSVKFSAALCKDNFYGTQFHPEKSGMDGAALLKYFLIVTRTPCLSWPDLTDRPATAELCHVLIHLPRRDSSVVLNK